MASKRQLLWTGPALRDLDDIRTYVSHDNPVAAKRLAQSVLRRVRRLRDHPHSGRIVPELPATGYREVIVPPYRVVYDVRPRQVIILRVWHGRRELGLQRPSRFL